VPPTFGDLRRFCQIDGWEETTKKRKGKDHYRYRKVLDDGSILHTRASHGNDEIGDPALWSRIWRHQLGLDDEDQFYEALRTGKPVDRGGAEPDEPTTEQQDAALVNALIHTLGLDAGEVREMSNDEMRARWAEFVAGQG
jgi:hypothetical protein